MKEDKTKTTEFPYLVNKKQHRTTICTCKRHKKTQIVYRDNSSEQSAIDLGVERAKVVRRNKVIVYLPEYKEDLNITRILSKCDLSKGESFQNIQITDTLNKDCEVNKGKIKSDLILKDKVRDKTGINVIRKSLNLNKAKKFKSTPIKSKKKSFSSNSSIEHLNYLESAKSVISKSVRSSKGNFPNSDSLSLKNNSKNSRSEKRIDLKSPTTIIKADEISIKGVSWVRESSKDFMVRSNLSQTIHKDVSTTSSPPSLVARSLSSTKVLTENISIVNPSKIEIAEDINNKAEDVKAMFRLWEKKFKFVDENSSTNLSHKNIKDVKETDHNKIEELKYGAKQKHKTCKNIFSFFRKKYKDKNENSFHRKKVTAGRCELSDGIVIKIGLESRSSITTSALKKDSDKQDDKNMLQQSWLRHFITNSKESRKIVQLRWDNKLYGTSSNTVSELKNDIFKDTAIILKSKSDISPNASLQYNTRPKHIVNFKQDINAFLMPNTTCQIPVNKNVHKLKNCSVSSNNKKFRRKSENHVIEIFLPAKNFLNSDKSSDYITIHIPEEYFFEDSENRSHYTDEEVYNVVEYESKSDGENNNFKPNLNKGGTTVQTCREVIMQGSNVCIAKSNESSAIAQRIKTCLDMKCQEKPYHSQHLQSQRKCDLAENFLRDSCKHVMPHESNSFTTQMTKSQGQSSDSIDDSCDKFFEKNKVSFISSTEQGYGPSQIKEYKQIHASHFFSKLRKKSCSPLPLSNVRTCPKDSLEVCKRRKIYACSNKIGKMPMVDIKESVQKTESSTENCMDPCADSNYMPLEGILKFKGISDCSNCKNNENLSTKSTTVNPDPICQIPQPPCLEKCTSAKSPICTKTNSQTCHTRSPECITPKSKKVSQTESSQTKVKQKKSAQVTSSISHAKSLNSVDSNMKRQVDLVSSITCFCSGDENILPVTDSINTKEPLATSPGLHVPPTICPLHLNRYCCSKSNRNSFSTTSKANISSPCEYKNTTATFYQKSLVNLKKKRCNCIGKRNVVTSKFASDNQNFNTDTKKSSSSLLNAKPSKASKKDTNCGLGKESRDFEDVKSIDEKTSVRNESQSTQEKKNKIEDVNCDEVLGTIDKSNEMKELNSNKILEDMCKDQSNLFKTPTQKANGKESFKSLDAHTIQRKLSVSDIIEINICIKFKNPDASKATTRPQNAYNFDEKLDIHNIKTATPEIYQVDERKGNQIKGQTEDIKFSINIQSVNSKCNLSNDNNLNNCYYATNFKRENSINYSKHLLHDHQSILNFTNSENKDLIVNKEIANFEMLTGRDNFVSSKPTTFSVINGNIDEKKTNISKDVFVNVHKDSKYTKNALSMDESVKDIVNRKLVSILKKLSKNEKKEVLKQILETIGNMKSKHKTKKVNRIKHLMYAVLTSESDFEPVNDLKRISISSTRRQLDKLSKSKSSLLHEIVFEKTIQVNSTPTNENEDCQHNEVEHVSSDTNKKIKKIFGYSHTSCCCGNKFDTEENQSCCNTVKFNKRNCCSINVASNQICCCTNDFEVSKEIREIERSLSNQNNEGNLKEEEIQDLQSSKIKSILLTKMSSNSTTRQIESKIDNTCTEKVLNVSCPSNLRLPRRDKFVYLASDKVLFFMSDSKKNSKINVEGKQCRPDDILQLRKTKKAVLRIYSERISSSIIKLPKFISHRS